MSVIENFAELSAKEQQDFAAAIVKTINSEQIFTSETDFKVAKVEIDDFTGGLMIEVTPTNYFEVARDATWEVDDEEDAHSDPGNDVVYAADIYHDTKDVFKVNEAVIDGYKITLYTGDIDEGETVDVEVDEINYEDAGIGSYEFWGIPGYDSHPYIEVLGTITKACTIDVGFLVEPNDEVPVPTEDDED